MKQLFTYLLAVLALLTVSQKMVADNVYLQTDATLNNVKGDWDNPKHEFAWQHDNVYMLQLNNLDEQGYFFFRIKATGNNWETHWQPGVDQTPLTINNYGESSSLATISYANSYAWKVPYNISDYEYLRIFVDITYGGNRLWIDGKKKGSSGESYKSFYLIGNGEGLPWNMDDESRQFTTTDGETYTYTFPTDVTGNFYFRVLGKNENGTYFTEHLKPASIKDVDTNTPITTDFTEANYGNYASWKISLGSDKKYTVTFKYYGTTRNPEIKYDEVSTVVTDYTITVTGGGAMSDANQTGMFTCDLSEATEDGVISAFTIDGEAWGLSVAETAGTSSASTYTFVKGGTAALTLPKGFKYTLHMTANGVLTVTPSSSSTGRVLTEGFYLVGNFFNTDGDAVNYDNAIFKFREQQKDDTSNDADDNNVTYMAEIPASVTAHAQILQANFAGNVESLYGPGTVRYVTHTTLPTDQSLTGTSLKASTEAEGENGNYWDFTTRNVSPDEYTDGTYEISFVYNTLTKTVGSWEIHHNAHKRVAYYLKDSNDAVALPIYDSNKGEIGTGFSQKFFASINMEEGASYYVISNYVVKQISDQGYIEGIPQDKYGVLISNKTILPTLNKLFLTGNGGLDFKDDKPYNEVSPNEGPFRVGVNSGFDGTVTVEFDPSKGTDEVAKETNHYGVRGQIILRDANDRIKSVSMVGPAIPGTTNADGTWDYTSTVGDMVYDANENCYKLTLLTSADDGAEKFRFVGNHNSERTWYENGTDEAEMARTPYNDASAKGHRATTLDPNNVSYAKGQGKSTNYVVDSGSDVDIIWNRPAGKWTVRLYFNTVSGGNDPITTYYYTITENTNLEMRDYGDVHYKGNRRTIEGIGDYKYFVTWSDNKVWNKPANVDAFVVSDVTPATESEGAKVTLTQLDKDYLPANTGLVLAAKDKSSEGRITAYNAVGNSSTFNLLEEPMTEYTGTTEEITSKLSTQISPATVPTEANGGWNYLFGFYKKMNVEPSETDASKFLLGFWLSKGQNLSYPHCAYLHLTKEEASDKYYVGNKYVMGGSTTTSGAKLMPAVLLDFKSGVVTGITDLNAKESAKEDGKYYTLSGVAVSKPTASGIYIHNGKKYIVK